MNKSYTRLYRIYSGMKDRCNNKNTPNYKNYGDRGIKVCDEWLKSFDYFEKWARDHGYEDNLTIERIDVNGDYCPENCTWIPLSEQKKNTTKTVYIRAWEETKSLDEWIKDIRCYSEYGTIWARIKNGWRPEEAISTPIVIKKYLAFGEEKTLTEWCKDSRCKVDYDLLRCRIQKSQWDVEKAIITPSNSFHSQHILCTAYGETKTIKEWSKDNRCKVNYKTLYARLKYRKWNIKEAIETPIRSKRNEN